MSEAGNSMENVKPRRSWIRTALLFLVLIFVVNLALNIYMNLNYISALQRQTIDENTNAARIWTRTVDQELEAMNENLHELLIMIYSKTELRVGSEMMKASLKQEIYETMTNKMISNPHIDFFCLMDTDSDLYLFNANNLITGFRAAELKKLTAEFVPGNGRYFRDESWDLAPWGNETFFMKTVVLGKYLLTAGSSLTHYPIETIAPIAGMEPVLAIESDGKAYYCSDKSVPDKVLIDEDRHFIENSSMLSSRAEMKHVDGELILTVDLRSVQQKMSWNSLILIMSFSVLSTILLIAFGMFMTRNIIRPTRTLMDGISELRSGNLGYRISTGADNREFQEMTDSFNEMSQRIEESTKEEYERVKKEQEDRLHLLRAQIKPHFYLNAITTISNMTYQGRSEDIRKYCNVLAKYMRYMLEMNSDFTTVGEELMHIENYITMQQIRFPGSVTAEIHCEEAARDTRIPLLVMFTIVENSFKHAMDLYREMKITIDCRKTPEGCRIRITDNGPGFSDAVLENRNDTDLVFNTRNHIGLSNASHTLRLTYKRPDLLVLSNLPDGGACVDILIPDEPEQTTEESESL